MTVNRFIFSDFNRNVLEHLFVSIFLVCFLADCSEQHRCLTFRVRSSRAPPAVFLEFACFQCTVQFTPAVINHVVRFIMYECALC